jgi:hypothetical protein
MLCFCSGHAMLCSSVFVEKKHCYAQQNDALAGMFCTFFAVCFSLGLAVIYSNACYLVVAQHFGGPYLMRASVSRACLARVFSHNIGPRAWSWICPTTSSHLLSRYRSCVTVPGGLAIVYYACSWLVVVYWCHSLR